MLLVLLLQMFILQNIFICKWNDFVVGCFKGCKTILLCYRKTNKLKYLSITSIVKKKLYKKTEELRKLKLTKIVRKIYFLQF